MVASTRIANVTPKPSCLIFVTPVNENDAKTMAINRAAAMMIRPVRCRPKATTATSAPRVAERLSRLRMSALIGSRTLPVNKNKMISVVIAQSGDLHVRLTGEPAISDRVPARAGRVDQFRREPLHPPKQRHVIHLDAAALDKAPDPVGQGVPQVSAHRQRDHIRRKSEPGEG